MTAEKVQDQNVTDTGPVAIPSEISPTVYILPFFEWLQAKEENVQHRVRLRLIWLHAESFDKEGVVNYGEIGFDGFVGGAVTMTLGMTADLKKFLRGTALLYRSDERWGKPADSMSLSGLPFPFDPDQQSQVEVTIWTGSGKIDLGFSSRKIIWTIEPKYAASSNLLYGFPSGTAAPIVKPMIMLSLSRHAFIL